MDIFTPLSTVFWAAAPINLSFIKIRVKIFWECWVNRDSGCEAGMPPLCYAAPLAASNLTKTNIYKWFESA